MFKLTGIAMAFAIATASAASAQTYSQPNVYGGYDYHIQPGYGAPLGTSNSLGYTSPNSFGGYNYYPPSQYGAPIGKPLGTRGYTQCAPNIYGGQSCN